MEAFHSGRDMHPLLLPARSFTIIERASVEHSQYPQFPFSAPTHREFSARLQSDIGLTFTPARISAARELPSFRVVRTVAW